MDNMEYIMDTPNNRKKAINDLNTKRYFKAKTENIHKAVKRYLSGNPDKLPSISQWDVSEVKTMDNLFRDADKRAVAKFNEPLEQWNVSNVKNMSSMFSNATSFNQPLEQWNVSNVTNMTGMFHLATSFNQPLEKWNVSNVRDMADMFSNATSFNQPLEKWNVSNVVDMSFMFSDATAFNQPLEQWDTSKVTKMGEMFARAYIFNQPLEKWNVSNVNDMNDMFSYATSFNQPLEKWNVSNVNDMCSMFHGATSFNQPLELWNVSNVNDMSSMFQDASSFNQPLQKWNISNVANMTNMFNGTLLQNVDAPKHRQQDIKRRQEEMKDNSDRIRQQIVEKNSPYEECLLCGEFLNNIDGPGSTEKCQERCNDVVKICQNNHTIHRGCILNACNASSVNLPGQMGYNDYEFNEQQQRRNNCPFCQIPLLHQCSDFINVSKVADEDLSLKENVGGKRRKYIRKLKQDTKRIKKRKTHKTHKKRKSRTTHTNKLSTRKFKEKRFTPLDI